ncbi:uncharacterized protein [Macrobrachium rosenbergii]|uniref:uncharacterized protein n=1 Tax=Macrobrachium rosenbergii TaxID=79674 RepID=UPI0034D67209
MDGMKKQCSKSNAGCYTKANPDKKSGNETSPFPRDSKILGGNMDDRWIWKGKHPQSTFPPYLQKHNRPNITTNRLVTNQPLSPSTTEENKYFLQDWLQETTTTTERLVPNVPQYTLKWKEANLTHTINATPESIVPDASGNTLLISNATHSHDDAISQLQPSNSSIPTLILESMPQGLISSDNQSTPWVKNGDMSALPEETKTNEVFINLISTTNTYLSPLKSWERPETETISPLHHQRLDGTASPNSTSSYESYSASSFMFIVPLSVFMILSIISNMLVFTILCKDHLRKTFFLQYISLTVSNLLASIFSAPVLIAVILLPNSLSPVLCIFLSPSLILATVISVGSLSSISILRWWKFHNSALIRQHEKAVLCFYLLTLWIIGIGIILCFLSQEVIELKGSCSLSLISTSLQKSLPITAISVSMGLITIITANVLTIRKIKENCLNSHDNCIPFQNKIYYSQVLSNPQIFHQSSQNLYAPQSLDRNDTQLGKTTASQKSSNVRNTFTIEDESNPFASTNHLALNCPSKDLVYCNSEPESEHLYQIIEEDTQERFLDNATVSVHHESFTLPNAVESSNSSQAAAILKHETTLVKEPSPPTNLNHNNSAWKSNEGSYENEFPTGNEVGFENNFTQVKLNEENQNLRKTPNKTSHWPILQNPLNKGQYSHFQRENPLLMEPDCFNQIPNGFQNNGLSLPTLSITEIQESLCTGYMADLSATSSQLGTPNIKNRKKRAMHKHSSRINFGQNFGGESDDETNQQISQTQKSSLTKKSDRGGLQPSSGIPGERENDPTKRLKTHPVCQRCIQNSHRLIALYAIAYLPFIALQTAVYFMGPGILVIITLTYMILVSAIHSTLHCLQSPILKNAIRKFSKIAFFSKARKMNPGLSSKTLKHQVFPQTRISQSTKFTNSDKAVSLSHVKSPERPFSAPGTLTKLPKQLDSLSRPSSYPSIFTYLKVSESHADVQLKLPKHP